MDGGSESQAITSSFAPVLAVPSGGSLAPAQELAYWCRLAAFRVTALAWTAARRHHNGKYEQDANKPFESSITCHVKQTPLRNQNRKIFHTQLTYILLFDIYTSRSQIYLTFLRHQF